MLALLVRRLTLFIPGGLRLSAPSFSRPPHPTVPEPGPMSESYQLELIRAYASAGFAAVVTINSGALIAGISQATNLDFVPPGALAWALFIWAFGVTTGVATWGAAYHAVVALAAADHERDMRWRRTAAGLFHVSLSAFLLGFTVVGLSLLA